MRALLRFCGVLIAMLLTCGFFVVILPVLVILGLFFKGIRVQTVKTWTPPNFQTAEPPSETPASPADDDIIDVTAQPLDRKELDTPNNERQDRF